MDLLIWVFFFFSILTRNVHLTIAQNDFKYYLCSNSAGNYTENSVYKRNLDDLFYSLIGTNNGFGFYNLTSGLANAAALCRGDIQPDTCRRCVDDATRQLRQNCPNQIEAVIWYDVCFLRYSTRSMGYGDLQYWSWSYRNFMDSSYEQWNQLLPILFARLRREAAAGDHLRKYAYGNIKASISSTIYAIMQCTPELSATECDDCLTEATRTTRPYINGTLYPRERGFMPGCVFRYDDKLFFNSTWYPLPPLPSNNSHENYTPPPLPESKKSTNIGVIVGPILAASVVIAVIIFFIFRRSCQIRSRKGGFSDRSCEGRKHEKENEDSGEMNSFDLSTIQVATNNFSIENKLGEGGFGPVYWGKLPDGKEIAVKRLSRHSGRALVEFKTEVELIIKLQHKNLVRLLGYCIKGIERLLIYEFMANNSLDTFLFDRNKRKELDWAKRANIVTGIAKGLRYLHEDSRLKIIHKDMKAGNILLDVDMNSRISDFGIARIFGGNQMEANTRIIVGTCGYMAPEYEKEGLFSTKSDVYSFGVLLLEIISGQRNNQFSYRDQPQNFLSIAYKLWKENKGEDLIDPGLMIQNSSITEAIKWINIALLCVQEDPQDRPTMSTVVFMLEGQWSANLSAPSEPPASFARFTALSERTSTSGDAGGAHPMIEINPTSSGSTTYFSLAG